MIRSIAALLLLFCVSFPLQARESAKPTVWDFALESLSGVAGGAGGAYFGGLIGTAVGPEGEFMDLFNFVHGAMVGYPLGTAGGIYGYSWLAGKERNLPASLLASTLSGLAGWYLITNFYEDNQAIPPAVFLVLPNLTGVLGNNIRLMITKDAGAGVAWVGGF